jgi:peptide/nickel transport system substrate-binding protein
MQKKLLALFGIVMALGLVLAACQPTETTEPTPETIIETVVVTEEVIVTEVVTEIVTEIVEVEAPVERYGGWLDTMILVADPSVESAVARILADDIDVYAQTSTNAEAFQTVKDEGLKYVSSVGSFNEITLNPAGPELLDGTINPFAVPAIRKAVNLLIDRDYVVQEIMGGLALPKYTNLASVFPDYARYAATVRAIEADLAYNPEAANEVIMTEMEALGAEKVDDKWTYNGEPVTLIFLIRIEDERRQIGDYVSNQLESVGFTVDRQYKTSSEASPLWVQSDPNEGLWHCYTGGWISTAISRDDGSDFQFFYSPRSVYGFSPLWQNYVITDEMDAAWQALYNNDFRTMEERAELFTTALELGAEHAVRIWLVDRTSFSPMDPDVEVTYDLAAAIAGAVLAPRTIRWADEVGGEMTVAMADVLTDPWNGLAGSNWVYDALPQNATSSFGVVPDPFTGLYYPERIESAAITIEEGLPVGITLDWLTLDFAPEIAVPGDAWVDWNAADQVFITADEKLAMMAEEEPAEGEEAVEVPEYFTSKMKSVVTYPADLFETVKWHDGSAISLGDFVLNMILSFDQGYEDSEIFDESQVGSVESFLAAFKGFKVASTDPLTIEFYSDQYYLDAEWNVTTFWPQYLYGEHSWHSLALGYMAERDGELAFSADKADQLEVEWMGYTSGPSLEILRAKLDTAIEETFIPYAPTMGQFVTAEEAAERYQNMLDWYRVQGHFWVGTGPYYLNKVFPVEKTMTLTRYQDYPDLATRWAIFGEPQIAVVEIDGPGRVTIGEEVMFDAYVTFNDAPYPSGDIDEVKYLLFDATGTLADSGAAEMVEEGLYSVTLSAEVTGALETGSNRLEIIVVPNVVSIPTAVSFEFVTE